MRPEEVTAQIMEAWDEIEDEESEEPEAAVAVPGTDEPEEDREQEETPEEAEEEDEDGGEEEPDEEGEEAEEETEVEAQYEDVEVQAFLAKYGGDTEKALKGAAELQRVLGRQGLERGELAKRVAQLESQLAQAQAFGGAGGFLNDEQQAWVEAAVESSNPGVYIQSAMQQGEFELARAVCREWAQVNPFEATRAGQIVDAVEYQSQQQQSAPVEVPPATTWQELSSAYPELRTYEAQMVGTLERLGPDHPLVQEARSTDPNVAVRGIFGIYEIAKAATFSLTETKNGLKAKRRQEADEAVEAAAVTSASNSPSAGETPRRRSLMPGLSEEAFEAAFAPPQ